MTFLRIYRRILIWICICSDRSASKWQKFAHIAFTSLAILSLIVGSLSSFVVFFKSVITNLEDACYALGQIIASMIFLMSFSMAYSFCCSFPFAVHFHLLFSWSFLWDFFSFNEKGGSFQRAAQATKSTLSADWVPHFDQRVIKI